MAPCSPIGRRSRYDGEKAAPHPTPVDLIQHGEALHALQTLKSFYKQSVANESEFVLNTSWNRISQFVLLAVQSLQSVTTKLLSVKSSIQSVVM